MNTTYSIFKQSDFFNPVTPINISSLEWINESKQYHLLATPFLEEAKKRLPKHLYIAWLEIERRCKGLGGLITCTIKYLGSLFNTAERATQRTIRLLERLGWLKVQYNYDDHGSQLSNTYTVCIPDNVLIELRKYPDRKNDHNLEIDYSIDEPFFEGGGVVNDTPLIITNQDIITKSNITALTAVDQSKEQLSVDNLETNIKDLVPESIYYRLKRKIYSNRDHSNPSGLLREAIHFITKNPLYNPNRACNAFLGLLKKGKWSTPFSMRYNK